MANAIVLDMELPQVAAFLQFGEGEDLPQSLDAMTVPDAGQGLANPGLFVGGPGGQKVGKRRLIDIKQLAHQAGEVIELALLELQPFFGGDAGQRLFAGRGALTAPLFLNFGLQVKVLGEDDDDQQIEERDKLKGDPSGREVQGSLPVRARRRFTRATAAAVCDRSSLSRTKEGSTRLLSSMRMTATTSPAQVDQIA
jgi:hypothetical protein